MLWFSSSVFDPPFIYNNPISFTDTHYRKWTSLYDIGTHSLQDQVGSIKKTPVMISMHIGSTFLIHS